MCVCVCVCVCVHVWASVCVGGGGEEEKKGAMYMDCAKSPDRETVSHTLSFSKKRLTMLSSCSTLSSDRQWDACVSFRTRYG